MAGTMFWSFMVAILILVTIHEFGHYWVAKRCGVAIEKFSIGFGPTILTWTNKEGTEFVLAAFPLGGFVKMRGEYTIATSEQQAKQGDGSFAACSVWQRMAIVSAGPLVNFLFAIVILAALAYRTHEVEVPTVAAPTNGTLAAPLGLESGDVIESINGRSVQSWDALYTQLLFAAFDKEPIHLNWKNAQGQRAEGQLQTSSLDIENPLWISQLGIMPNYTNPKIAGLVDGGVAQVAGLKVGDELRFIDGQKMVSRQDVVRVFEGSAGRSLILSVARAGQILELSVTPKSENGLGKVGISIGGESKKDFVSESASSAVVNGVHDTFKMGWINAKMIFKIMTGQMSTKNIGGPVSMAKVTGEAASHGLISFLKVLAIISLSLGALNLLPIPVLDGGHLVYYAFEAIMGRPVSDQALAIGQRVGLALLLCFMGIAFFNDAQGLFG